MVLYKNEEDPYDIETFLQFNDNLINYWDFTSGVGLELAKLATHFHSICVNSALVERLWSNMSFLHTNRRNHLQVNLLMII